MSALQNRRLSINEAVELIKKADFKLLGRMAKAKKKELHPEAITTFIVDRNITIQIYVGLIANFVPFTQMKKGQMVIF